MAVSITGVSTPEWLTVHSPVSVLPVPHTDQIVQRGTADVHLPREADVTDHISVSMETPYLL